MAQLKLILRRLRLAVKATLPKGLLARSLLILVTPMLLLQLVSAYIFYGTHWDMVTRRFSLGLAGDIGAVAELLRTYPGPQNRAAIFAAASWPMEMDFSMEEGGILDQTGMVGAQSHLESTATGYNLEENLMRAMVERLRKPVFIDTASLERDIIIKVQLVDGVLTVKTTRKRLYSPTTTVFVLWMAGTSLLLLGIATLFMRNQVRAVRRLAAAADSFGKGRDVPNFHPEGAVEVRQAASALALMHERIKRQISQRTEMLAGVSHDLRTPLTRMKLQLAMMQGEGVAELEEDVAEMERMVEGYLAFARGEGTEKPAYSDLVALLEEVVAKLRREGAAIDLHCEEELSLLCRPQALSRSFMNLAGNAVRYGNHVAIRAGRRADGIEVTIDDDGPGIPEHKREEVFKAFVRLEGSRNPTTGGIGLGMTIARDLVRSHGGDLSLEDSPLGGLRVRLRLPT